MTKSTLIGTGFSAVVHGTLTGLGFWLTGLPNATLWGFELVGMYREEYAPRTAW